jgi:hypothetical protein
MNADSIHVSDQVADRQQPVDLLVRNDDAKRFLQRPDDLHHIDGIRSHLLEAGRGFDCGGSNVKANGNDVMDALHDIVPGTIAEWRWGKLDWRFTCHWSPGG